jgi:hypothetical protein
VVSRRAAKVCIPLSPLHHTPFHAEGVQFSDGAADSQNVSGINHRTGERTFSGRERSEALADTDRPGA